MGAAMLAIIGLNWYESVEKIVDQFIIYDKTLHPNKAHHERYVKYFEVYQEVYRQPDL